MRIRDVVEADRDSWLRMRSSLWPDAIEEHQIDIDSFLRGRSAFLQKVLVCESEPEELVGFIELSIRNYAEGSSSNKVPYIEGWYIDPSYRRTGLGTLLVRKAESWAQAAGFTELASDAEIENQGSITAHAALGFDEVERSIHFLKRLER